MQSVVSGYKDVALRLFWTVVAAAGSAIIGAGALDVKEWKAAAMTGIAAGISFLTLYARQQLPNQLTPVAPNPTPPPVK